MPRPTPGPGKKPPAVKPKKAPAPQHRPRPPAPVRKKTTGTTVPRPTPVAYGGGGGRPSFGLSSANNPPAAAQIPTGTFLAGGGQFAQGYFGEPVPLSQGQEYTAALAAALGQTPNAQGGGFPGVMNTAELLSGGGGGGGGDGGGGGGGDGGPAELVNIKWKPTTFNVGSGNAPSWWAPKIPEDPANAADPRVNFLMTLNSMIPFLSPEDQRNAAAQLYSIDADNFSEYKPEAITTAVPVTEEVALAAAREGTPAGPQMNQQYFQSSQRARDAINLLSQMREQTVGGNRWQISPAYTLLQQILGAQEQFGGGAAGGQTRSQQLAMMGALDPLLAQTRSPEAGGFGAIAQLLSQPFFSQGKLSPTFQGPSGNVLFGRPNPALGF